MLKIFAALSCIFWPHRPIPISLDRAVTLPPNRTIVISLPYDDKKGRLPVPMPGVVGDVRIVIVDDILFISFTNRGKTQVTLPKGYIVGNLVIGGCNYSKEV